MPIPIVLIYEHRNKGEIKARIKSRPLSECGLPVPMNRFRLIMGEMSQASLALAGRKINAIAQPLSVPKPTFGGKATGRSQSAW